MFKKIKEKIYYWIVSVNTPCDKITEQLSYSMERRLKLADRLKLKIHLKTCTWCTAYGHQLEFISKALKYQAEHPDTYKDTDHKLPDDTKEKLKNLLKNE